MRVQRGVEGLQDGHPDPHGRRFSAMSRRLISSRPQIEESIATFGDVLKSLD
jgi:hypothetical protein